MADAKNPVSLDGLYNDEDPLESLGELDLGDNVEDDNAPAPDDVEDDSAPVDSDTVEDTPSEETAEEDAVDEDAVEPDAPGDEADGDSDAADEDTPTEAPTEAPEAEKAKPKEPFIPKSRLDQRTAQLRAAERELEEARNKLQQVESERQKAEREANSLTDEQIQEKMNAANAALLEGKTDEATKLQSEVFAALRQSGAAPEDSSAPQIDPNKIAADVRDQMTFEQTLERIYQEYPALNDSSDQFDETISQEAVDLQAFYFQQGYTRAEATERAATAVGKIYGLQSAQQETAPTSKKADMARQAQQQSKRAKVAKAQKAPPETSGGAGRTADSTDSVDVESLTVDDWSALPDSVRSRLLGDAL